MLQACPPAENPTIWRQKVMVKSLSSGSTSNTRRSALALCPPARETEWPLNGPNHASNSNSRVLLHRNGWGAPWRRLPGLQCKSDMPFRHRGKKHPDMGGFDPRRCRRQNTSPSQSTDFSRTSLPCRAVGASLLACRAIPRLRSKATKARVVFVCNLLRQGVVT